MKITALLENTTQREDMKVEHGLSLYIETLQHKILFDMGQTELFCENARTLGIDLAGVDLAVLSHGHFDHGGGLKKFLEINDHAPVYIHTDAFLPHYSGADRYIGLDTSLMGSSRFVFTGDECPIDDSLCLFSCNDREKTCPLLISELNEKTGEGFISDDFRHEQYLLIRENGKSVLISGCSHKGIVNIARWFSPDVLIGGFHFSKLPMDAYLEAAARELASCPTEFYTCHCTGKAQFDFMGQFMPGLHYLSCGQRIEL